MSHTYLYMYDDTRYLSLLIRFKQLSLFSTPSLRAKADAKIQPFSIPPKYFLKKIAHTSGKRCVPAPTGTKKNSPWPRRGPRKTGVADRKNTKNGPHRGQKGAKNTQNTRSTLPLSALRRAGHRARDTFINSSSRTAAHRLPYGAPTAVLQ